MVTKASAENKENRMDLKLQFCDDEDEEVFFGEVGTKERRKASKYNSRRTAVYDSGFRRDRRLMRYTMDRLSMMSLNQNLPEPRYGSDGSELCESPLGSGISGDSPLGSESGTTSSGEQSPVVNGWIDPDSLDILMSECRKRPLLENHVSVLAECCDADESNNCLSFINDALLTNNVHDLNESQKNDEKVGQSKQSIEELVALDQSNCSLQTGDQSGNNISKNENIDQIQQFSQNMQHSDDTNSGVSQSDNFNDPVSDLNSHGDSGLCISEQFNTREAYRTCSVDVENSPLLNSCTDPSSISSPHVTLDNLVAMDNTTLIDVFAQSRSVDKTVSHDHHPSYDHYQSHDHSNQAPQPDDVIPNANEQEVPNDELQTMLLFGNHNERQDLTRALEDHAIGYHGDVSIVTIGTVMEESLMDTSRRLFHYGDDSIDVVSPQCHLVPEVSVEPDIGATDFHFKALGRMGLVFTEKQFSPTLTVIASPHHSDEDTSPVAKDTRLLNSDCSLPQSPRLNLQAQLFLDEGSSRPCSLPLSPHRPPDSPLSPADVKFTFLKDSPKRSRIKRLSQPRSPHSEPRTVGVVFDRLNSLDETSSSNAVDKAKTTKKSSLHRPHSASKLMHQPRLNTACQLRIAARNKNNLTPKKSLNFGVGLKCDSVGKGSIKTTGTMNRRAISEVTGASLTPQQKIRAKTTTRSTPKSTPGSRFSGGARYTPETKSTPGSKSAPGSKFTPQSKLTPGSRSSSGSKSVALFKSPAPPIYKRGTPRYHDYGSKQGMKLSCSTPVPKFDLDDSELDGDISVLDDSIILQEKKVELERLRAKKMKLQKEIAKQAQIPQRVESSHQRSPPLVPTTADNLPRVRMKNKQALSLSEPELDAITLVHTLCNSQQVAKLVTKARATTVIRHNYVQKEASKLQWCDDLVPSTNIIYTPQASKPTRKSILNMRAADDIFPYNDQAPSPVVVTKSTRRSTAYGKEPSPLLATKPLS